MESSLSTDCRCEGGREGGEGKNEGKERIMHAYIVEEHTCTHRDCLVWS